MTSLSERGVPNLFSRWCVIRENKDALTFSPNRWLKMGGWIGTLAIAGMSAGLCWIAVMLWQLTCQPQMAIWQAYAAALSFALMGLCFLLLAVANPVLADYARIKQLKLSPRGLALSAWWNARYWSWTEVDRLDVLCFRSIRKHRARLYFSATIRDETVVRHIATFAIGWVDEDVFCKEWPAFAESLRSHVFTRLILRDQYSDQNKIVTLLDTNEPSGIFPGD